LATFFTHFLSWKVSIPQKRKTFSFSFDRFQKQKARDVICRVLGHWTGSEIKSIRGFWNYKSDQNI